MYALALLLGPALALAQPDAGTVKIMYTEAPDEQLQKKLEAAGFAVVGNQERAKTPRLTPEVWFLREPFDGGAPGAELRGVVERHTGVGAKLARWTWGGDTDFIVVTGTRPSSLDMVAVDDFFIDRTEATVERFAECVKGGACTRPVQGKLYNWGRKGRERHPVNGITRAQAVAFCAWQGKRLPTVAEWRRAWGPGRFPWGDQPFEAEPCKFAVVTESLQSNVRGCGEDGTQPVCSRPAGNSKQGVCDLIGNVFELTSDTRRGSFGEVERSTIGTSFYQVPSVDSTAADYSVSAEDRERGTAVGIRCAWTPPQAR